MIHQVESVVAAQCAQASAVVHAQGAAVFGGGEVVVCDIVMAVRGGGEVGSDGPLLRL